MTDEILTLPEVAQLLKVGGPYFGAGIETEEQLDAALTGLREACARLIGAGKKVVPS